MRPFKYDYDEIDEFDDFGYGGVVAIRHMMNEKQRLGERRHSGPARKKRWDDDEWDQYDDYDDNDYDDYNDDEFDRSSGLDFEHH